MLKLKKIGVRPKAVAKKKDNTAEQEAAALRETLAGLTERMEKLAAGEPEIGGLAAVPGLLPETAALAARADKAQQAIAASLRGLIEVSAVAEKEAPAGNFNHPTDPAQFTGCYATIVTRVNRAFAGIIVPLREIVRQIRAVSDESIAVDDTIEFQGEFAVLHQQIQELRQEKQEEKARVIAAVRTLNEKAEGMAGVAREITSAAADTRQQIVTVMDSADSISSGMTQSAATLSSSTSNIGGIAASVEEMSGTIRNLAAASEQTSASVNEVSRLVADIFGNIQNVSDSTDEVNHRVDASVHSIREISQSLDEVGSHCEKALQIAARAKETVGVTNGIINKLDQSSRQIGKVVGLINDIASQTNILALNAAIEAASAGDAGRGFAVVANEVKELAKQTADATGDIRQQIDTMQQNMANAVKAVTDINEVVENLSGISGTIAAAVTEQTASASQITTSVTEAAEELSKINDQISTVAGETKDVSHSTEESAKGVQDIARSATELSKAAAEAAKNSETASQSVQEANQAMSDIMGEISKVSELIHKTEEVAGSHQLNADKVKAHSDAIFALSEKMSQNVRQEIRHE